MKSEWEICYDASDELLMQAIELDSEAFSGKDVGMLKKCREWLSVNRDIYTMLLHDGEVVGYINFLPVTDECYDKFKKGKYKDYLLTKEDVLDFQKCEENKCLMMSIVVDNECRDALTLRLLWKGFKDKIEKLRSSGVVFSSVIMDCVTPIGEKCAKKFMNGKYICDSDGGKIYEGVLE